MTYLSVHLIPFVQQCTAVLRLLTMNSVRHDAPLHFLPRACRLPTQSSSVECPTVLDCGDKRPLRHKSSYSIQHSDLELWILSLFLIIYDYFNLRIFICKKTPQTCMSLLYEQMNRNTQEPTRCTYETWTGTLPLSALVWGVPFKAVHSSVPLKCSTSSTSSTTSWLFLAIPWLKKWNHSANLGNAFSAAAGLFGPTQRDATWRNARNSAERWTRAPQPMSLPMRPDVKKMIRIRFGSFWVNFCPCLSCHIMSTSLRMVTSEPITKQRSNHCTLWEKWPIDKQMAWQVHLNCIPASQKNYWKQNTQFCNWWPSL